MKIALALLLWLLIQIPLGILVGTWLQHRSLPLDPNGNPTEENHK